MSDSNQIVAVAERIVESLDNSLNVIATHTDLRSEEIKQKLQEVRNRTSDELEYVRSKGVDDEAAQRVAELLAFVKTIYDDVRTYLSGTSRLH